jgi:alkyldihydroxyacetonephosphate synthase
VKVKVDRRSLLAYVDGEMTLGEVEASLTVSGLTLDVAGAKGDEQTVASWLAGGARGARETWLDPADHLIAGCEVMLSDGTRFEIRPAPRRAVGPDLVALFVGMGARFGTIERAWLRVHPIGVERPNHGGLALDPNPPVSEGESRLLETIAASLAHPVSTKA